MTKWSYEDKIRIECVADLQDSLRDATNEIIKMHGHDPQMNMILAAAYYGAILNLKSIDERIPENIFMMLGTTNI